MKILISEAQFDMLLEMGQKDVDERARTFANTRKKRLFPKSAMKSNPDRFKEYDKEVKGIDEQGLTDQQIKSSLMQSGWNSKDIDLALRLR